MFLVLSGAARADATPWPRGDGQRGAPASAPALLGASAFLTRSARQETVRVEAQRVGRERERFASRHASRRDRRRVFVVVERRSASSSASFDSPSAKAFSRPRFASRDSRPRDRRGGARGAAFAHAPEAYVAVLLASTCSLSRLLRQFISLGLNRVWLRAGESAYVAGEQATSMFVLISGRVRLLRDGNENLENLENLEDEETRDDGETHSARDAVGEDGSASSFRAARRARGGSEERGRGETIGEAPLLANGRYPSTATCLRDSELVRMSRGALTLVCARHPNAASRLLEAMARKLHATLGPAGSSSKRPDLVTIALVPASAGANEAATATLAASLRDALATNFGPTLWLDERAARDAFTDGTMTRLENAFYRSKLTGWMAQQEENYRFILLQADASDGAWSRVCVSQADRVAVVAKTSPAGPSGSSGSGASSSSSSANDAVDHSPSRAERRLLWRRRRGAAVELVLVHDPGAAPAETRRWRASRAEVRRHHMLRLSSDADVQRLARHVAGRAVGVVLTGGGGHGLAHLGALRALEDAGVPVDAVGGTSRGALVAALYAKYASTTHMLPRVKELVGVLSSPRHLLADLTLPILSVFSGKGLDAILRKTLGEDDVEDLWLPFFCCSTNLTRGRLSTHVAGRAWRRVRASMTTLGLLPPVVDERGELLVDGGYLNAIPADVMRETMGADVVIAVDVEDDDYLAFRDLTPRDGGLGGWRLLWERVDPLAGARATLSGAHTALTKAFPFTMFSGSRATDVGRLMSDERRDPSASVPANKNDDGGGETSRKKTSVSYASLLSALLHATSSRQFAQASREHAIDLYLRPPGVSGWTAPLTPRRVDALVRRAHAHSCVAVEAWRAREARAEARAAAADGARARPREARRVDLRWGARRARISNSMETRSELSARPPRRGARWSWRWTEPVAPTRDRTAETPVSARTTPRRLIVRTSKPSRPSRPSRARRRRRRA
jgi:lysophospholipid hydrolase